MLAKGRHLFQILLKALVMEHPKTAIDLVFVNNLHHIVSHGVQEFAASDHSVVFAVKKAGVARPMRKFVK